MVVWIEESKLGFVKGNEKNKVTLEVKITFSYHGSFQNSVIIGTIVLLNPQNQRRLLVPRDSSRLKTLECRYVNHDQTTLRRQKKNPSPHYRG